MTRMSKQGERRHVSKKRPSLPAKQTGPIKDNLAKGYKMHLNSVEGDLAQKCFIPKIKSSISR